MAMRPRQTAALTPARQRGYWINLNQAKQPATRVARIETFRDRIVADN
jgi:uncharacterized protein YdeI (YjbR/CyaY-like superfamily)